jgi:hypothetical protein
LSQALGRKNSVSIFPNGGSIFLNGGSIFSNGVSIFLYGVGVFPNGGSICQYHLCSYQSSAKKSAVAIGNDLEIRLFSVKVALVARFSRARITRARENNITSFPCFGYNPPG